ncbi:P-loop containing nucleoside triphosphate hydrolase protein [Lipomyces arxii]|uniref:P-loop containing nucleoside triphosphate hydrolase protein n=1 Tax=Lipomyces arxii TaxID=56418 RepID=UPI0034CEA984
MVFKADLKWSGTGKSCITMRLVRNRWVDEYDPTIEDSYSTTRQVDDTEYELEIIDTAGQEEYRGLLSSLWQGDRMADAYLLVYDVSSLDSLIALEYFDNMIDSAQDAAGQPGRPPIKMVAGNKCDLKHDREVSSAEGVLWARQHGSGFTETSALKMVNIEETFEILVRKVLENRKRQSVADSSTTATTYSVTSKSPATTYGTTAGAATKPSMTSISTVHKHQHEMSEPTSNTHKRRSLRFVSKFQSEKLVHNSLMQEEKSGTCCIIS